MTQPYYHTIKETTALLRMGRTKLYEAIKAGELQTVLRGSKRLVVASSVRAFHQRELEGSHTP